AGIQLRLLCNLLDGMVAIEGGLQSKSGDVFNEVPDRVSDALILLGAGYATAPALGLAWAGALGSAAALLAVLTAYVRALGATVGGLLAAALAALCVAERRHLREFRQRTLFQRWLTWLLITPTYALAVLGGEVTALALVSALVFVGLQEYGRLVGLPRLYRMV